MPVKQTSDHGECVGQREHAGMFLFHAKSKPCSSALSNPMEKWVGILYLKLKIGFVKGKDNCKK